MDRFFIYVCGLWVDLDLVGFDVELSNVVEWIKERRQKGIFFGLLYRGTMHWVNLIPLDKLCMRCKGEKNLYSQQYKTSQGTLLFLFFSFIRDRKKRGRAASETS